MTNEKLSHTAGTWNWYWKTKIEDGFARTDCGVIASQYTNMRNARVICRAPRYQTKEQWEADARLILAAPKLLEALMMITDQLELIGDNRKDAEFIDAARQAIAEATGDTNERT